VRELAFTSDWPTARGGGGGSRSKLKTADPERKVEPCLGLHRQRLQDKRALGAAMFLHRLQINHDGTDILTAKSEFRHIWMAKDDALAQSFLQELDRVALGKSAKQWSLRMPALADAADRMTTRAIPFEKSRAAVEGGYVRGSSSGRQEGEIDPQR
jgi:hypothetical protein